MAHRANRPSPTQRASILGVRTGDRDGGIGASTTRPDHLGALDGLRGVAVIAVIAYHLDRLAGGFAGVDVFFVLSGFLISRLLIAEHLRTGRISLRGFWARRVRRLVPAMSITAVAVMVAGQSLLPPWRWAELRGDALAALGFVANWRFIDAGRSYFDATSSPSPLRHTWSLAVEEQFYLIWPLLFVLAAVLLRRRIRWAMGLLSITVTVVSATLLLRRADAGWDLSHLYFATDTRIFAMAIGGIIASFLDPVRERTGRFRTRRSRTRSPRDPTVDGASADRIGVLATGLGWLGLLGILVLLVVADDQAPWMYRHGFLAIAVCTAAAIVGIGIGGGRLEQMLSIGPLRWIGERSYGLYLSSWPLQVFAEIRFPGADRIVRDAGIVAASVLVAALSFRFVERPIVEGRPPWRRRHAGEGPARRTGRVPAVVIGSAVAIALIVGLAGGAVPAPDYLSIDEEAAVDAALAPGGFSGSVGDRPAPDSTLLAPDRSGLDEASRDLDVGNRATVPSGDVLDPGPDPPFDPDDPLFVSASDTAAETIRGRPLRIMLMGDSVPLSLTPIDAFAHQLSIEVDNRSLMGCSILPADWSLRGVGGEIHPYADFCRIQEEAQAAGLAARPDVVLLWTGAWEVVDHRGPEGDWHRVGGDDLAEQLRAELQRRIDSDRAAGVPTIIARTPCFGTDPEGRRTVERPADALDWWNELVVEVASRNPGWVRMIDPEPWVCPDGDGDRPLPDGNPIRPDGMHFGLEGRRHLWTSWLEGAIASAFPTP